MTATFDATTAAVVRSFDAIVIGSGATGGIAALALTKAGMRVLMLEAGAPVEHRSDYGSPITNVAKQLYRHWISKRQGVQQAHATYWMTNPDFFVDDRDNPYTTPDDKPFRWIRSRRLGGRTLTWDGVTPRFSDFEFKAASRDGIGVDWPIAHDDLAPHYAKIERLLDIHGARDGLAQLPDGDYAVARPMTAAERLFKERVERKFRGRRVIISRGIRAARKPRSDEKHSQLSSVATTIERAARTGKLSIRTHAIAARIIVEQDGSRARGVEIIDAISGRTDEVLAPLVFVCASTIESVRILMSSKSRAHPSGIGASSSVLGRFVMDHIATNVYFRLPDSPDDDTRRDLRGSDAILIPRYQNLDQRSEDFPRGFGLWGGIQRLPIPRALMKKRGAIGFLCARAETLAHENNRVELDSSKRDRWGLQAARISFEWSKSDREIVSTARRHAIEMIEAAGGEVAELADLVHMPRSGRVRDMEKEWACSTPGLFCHEVGGARMGSDPKSSVVDSFARCWDVPNVFVTDGACWPSCGWQNPTLTMMAVTLRACAHAVDSLKRLDA